MSPLPLADASLLSIWAGEPVDDSRGPCPCGVARHRGWASFSAIEWPPSLQPVATLRDPDLPEPTFAEHRPGGIAYDAPDAPVAPRLFPYNRCDVHRCERCGRHVLRYTEFGGYYVDHRMRCLNGLTVLDVAPETA